MNLDLYTDEFRNFKYLKCDALAVNYFKLSAEKLNKIQPWSDQNDPNFVWETRLEFVEQLFDLANDTLYFVVPADLTLEGTGDYSYEDSRIYEIEKPFIYMGKSFHMENVATLADIPAMEEDPTGFFFTSYKGTMQDRIYLPMSKCPLIPADFCSYAAMFYSREWAEKYKDAITYSLRKNVDAIRTISRFG